MYCQFYFTQGIVIEGIDKLIKRAFEVFSSIFFMVAFVRGHVDVKYSEWSKFKMAAKMVAEIRFILKSVCGMW